MIGHRLAGDLPVVPDPDEARRWVEQELAKPEYVAARPTPFDRFAQAVGDFLAELFQPRGAPGWSGLASIIVIVVVVALLVAAFLIWGRPRVIRRSQSATAELFGGDERSAAELRREAQALAAASDWCAAIVVRFRALARGVAERGVVDPVPGATVHAFARQTARAFPDQEQRLEASAAAFDDVRYLRRPGTAELYALVTDTDDAIARTPPAALADLAERIA